MSYQELQERLFEEIRKIPESRLPEVFDVVHHLRVSILVAEATQKLAADRAEQALKAITEFRGSGPSGAAEALVQERTTCREHKA